MKKIKVTFVILVYLCVLCIYSNIYAVKLSVGELIGINVTPSDSDNYILKESEIFVYNMKINNDTVYCLNPGLSASKNNNYIEITDNNAINQKLKEIMNIYNDYKDMDRAKILRALIADISEYDLSTYGLDEEDIVVLKQILIWRAVKLVSTAEGLSINVNEERAIRMSDDVCNIRGIDKESKKATDILNAIKDVENNYRTFLKVVDQINTLPDGSIKKIVNKILNKYNNSKKISLYYKNVHNNLDPDANWDQDTQILIGPPTTPPPTNVTHKYTIKHKYYGPTNGYEGEKIGTTISYTGNSTTVDVSNKLDTSYNGIAYNFTGAGNNEGYMYTNQNKLVNIQGDGTVVICYSREYLPSTIQVTHHYISSTGNEVDKKSDTITNYKDVKYSIDLWSKYVNFYDNETSSGTTYCAFNSTNNKIDIGFNEGSNVKVDIFYRSKKVITRYVLLCEHGHENATDIESSGEIPLTKTISIKLNEQEQYYSTIDFGCDKCSSRFSGKKIGIRVGSSGNWNYLYKWTYNGDISISEKESKEYYFDIYYEVRDVHININDIGNNYKASSKDKFYIMRNILEVDGNKKHITYPEFDLKGNGKLINDDPESFGSEHKIKKKNLYSNFLNIGAVKLVPKKEFKYGYKNGNSGIKRYDNALNNLSSIKNNLGVSIKSLRGENDNFTHADTLILNLDYDIIPPVEVYVRHVIKNGDGTFTVSTEDEASFLKNDTEIYKDSIDTNTNSGWKVIDKGYNQRKYHSNMDKYTESIPKGFSEYFVIDSEDILKLSKSGTLLNDGVQYKLLGYKKSTNKKIEMTTRGYSNYNGFVTVTNTKSNDKVYVDFYYEKVDYSNDTPDPDKFKNLRLKANPVLKFQSQNENGNSLGADTENIAYVPASEYIKPYFETAKYVPYDLKYKISKVSNSGEPVYSLARFNSYEIEDVSIKNKTKEGSNAVMLGNSSENVISAGDNYSLKNRLYNIAPVVSVSNNYSADKVKFTENTNTIPLGELTNINNFNGRDYVEGSKYNGLRLGDGTVTYKMVNIVGKASSHSNATISTIKNMDVNIYTPMSVDTPSIESTGSFVNHSDKDGNSFIQKDTEFKIIPKIKDSDKLEYTNNLPSISKYLKGYIIKFDFNVKIGNNEVPAKTPIWINKDESISCTPVGEIGENSVNQLQEKIDTIAVTINTSNDLLNNAFGITSFNTGATGDTDKTKNTYRNSNVIGQNKTNKMTDSNSINNAYEQYGINMFADSYYFVKNITATFVLARLYDFKITDCYDVNYKNVFRQFDSVNGTVNGLTNICFYSGKNKLLISEGNNIIYSRAENTILPLGPYKHTQKDYTKAPKLGYRISFDVKTYGYYNYSDSNEAPKRRIQITPKYYYISKDGQIYKENIKLYYKNSSGKYITFNDSNYNIAFTPNDGYRSQYNNGDTPDSTNLSTKKVNLSIGKIFTLEPKTMMTTSNDKFIQAWYGEYKVPNSTIIVEENNGKVDLNNPLTDGYLGVIFKIECIDEGEGKKITILYDQDDKAAQGGNHNTSEWDYEGYLGCVSGKNFSGTLQLEKGKWEINDDLYQKIKGTVVLYDIDDRAANDFD